MTVSPRAVAPLPTLEERRASLELAKPWAIQPALDDIASVTPKPTESTAVESAQSPEGEVITPLLGTPLRALVSKREVESVKFLLRIPAEENSDLEFLLDNVPRSSKQRLIIFAIQEYAKRVKREIEKRNQAIKADRAALRT